MRTPAEEAAKLAGDAQRLASRLQDADSAARFTKGDVDRIVASRLGRERKLRGEVERERDRLDAELERLLRRLEGTDGLSGLLADERREDGF